MRPMRPASGSPMLVHVAPASVDLYTPSPMTSTSRIAHASPVPAHTMFGSDCDTASAPIAIADCLSKIGEKVFPSSVDFHTPPDAAPRYHVRKSPATPAIDAMRPPNEGPTNWNCSAGG